MDKSQLKFYFAIISIIVQADKGICQSAILFCWRPCTAEHKPICGSDGETYENRCILDTVICVRRLQGEVLTAAHQGRCDDVLSTSDPLNCDVICDEENGNRVCANNGITYNSHCEFNRANCEAENSISILHSGDCTNNDKCLLICNSQQVKPVCSAANETFKNECYLKKLYCNFLKRGDTTQAQKYALASHGACDGVDYTDVHTVNCSRSLSLGQNCPLDYDPVCGVDHKTYNTKCEYCQYLKTQNLLDENSLGDAVLLKSCPAFILIG